LNHDPEVYTFSGGDVVIEQGERVQAVISKSESGETRVVVIGGEEVFGRHGTSPHSHPESLVEQGG